MEKCLVTKLKGTVVGQGFEKLGELTIGFSSDSADLINLHFESTTAQIITVDNGSWFTDATGNPNFGASVTLAAGRSAHVIKIPTGGTFYLRFSNKSGIRALTNNENGMFMWPFNNYNFKIYLNSKILKYCTGLEELVLPWPLVYGAFDLEDFKNLALKNLVINNDTIEVTGGIANLANSPLSYGLQLPNKGVYGDIGVFKNKTIANNLDLSNTDVHGSLLGVSDSTADYILLRNLKKPITDNLGLLKPSVKFISFGNSAYTNLWFSDWAVSRTKFLAVEGGYMEWGINDFIKKSATLTVAAGLLDYEKKISMNANGLDSANPQVKTALQTLRTKGVDVVINGVLVN